MDISKVEISGPCRITVNGVDIGHTLGGVELQGTRKLTDVNVDRYGETPIDKVLSGNTLKAVFTMAQTEWAQWDLLVPETSSYNGAGAADRADFGADAGASLRAEGKLIVIHPLKNMATDLSDDVTIYKAVSAGDFSLPMRVDEQRALEITLEALVVEDFGTGRRLGHYGPADVS